MQFNTAGENRTQPANVVIQQSAARQPIVSSTAPAGGILDTVEHAASHSTAPDSCRGLHSQEGGGHVADCDAAMPPAAADLAEGSRLAAAAEADPALVSHDEAAIEAGSAAGSSEAATAEDNQARQEAVAGETDAATMAAWLIQKPLLLQGVLGHLESLAANTFLKSSASIPFSNPPAGLRASSSTGNTMSAVSACDTLASATTWGCCHTLDDSKVVLSYVAASAGWCSWDQGWPSVCFAGSFC